MRISDWSSDVCSSDLHTSHDVATPYRSAYAIYVRPGVAAARYRDELPPVFEGRTLALRAFGADGMLQTARLAGPGEADGAIRDLRSAEHTSELQSLMRISYAVFCLKKKTTQHGWNNTH